MSTSKQPPGIKIIAQNRRARHEYEVLQTLECGIVLQGTEVKALRNGRVNLGDAYAEIRAGEVWLVKMHIGPYDMGNRMNHEPFRPRKLLLNRREIRKLAPRIEEGGLTLVPLKIYFKRGRVKVEIALARGKKLHDKRHDKARRDAEREMARSVGRRE
jgi:SsrA-binding protein